MEPSISTIVCPNCGANPKNRHNCEYCGSMLIRFVDKNITIDEKYKKNARVISGLEEALKSNLLIQKNHINGIIPITEITSTSDYDNYQVFPLSEATFGINAANPYDGQIGIVLRIPFLVRSSNYQVAQEAQARLIFFKSQNCFPLFDEINVPEGYYYILDCGEDYETASRILSSVIMDNDGEQFVCNTHSIRKDTVITDARGDSTQKKSYGYLIVSAITILLVIITLMLL